jgi:hypothetical protein
MIDINAQRVGHAAWHRGGATAMQIGIAAHIGISSSLADYKLKAGCPKTGF